MCLDIAIKWLGVLKESEEYKGKRFKYESVVETGGESIIAIRFSLVLHTFEIFYNKKWKQNPNSYHCPRTCITWSMPNSPVSAHHSPHTYLVPATLTLFLPVNKSSSLTRENGTEEKFEEIMMAKCLKIIEDTKHTHKKLKETIFYLFVLSLLILAFLACYEHSILWISCPPRPT